MSDLLLEIGTEEIPAGYIVPALEQLASAVRDRLTEHRISPERMATAGTPRRLVVAASGIPSKQPPAREAIVGPPAAVAFDEKGKPGKAALGFARAQGVAVESLRIEQTAKGPYVVAEIEHEGRPALQILPDVLRQAVLSISFPKSMRWPTQGNADSADQRPVRFARPIRWIVALLDREVIPVEIAGLAAGRTTFGHPFLAPGGVELRDASFDAYREALRQRRVLVDPTERREAVRAQVCAILQRHGSRACDARLLEEVTNLVEHPHALEGAFDQQFLELPDCVLAAAMTEHQRYFPVRDADGRLLNRFVVVSDRSAEQADTVRKGNERVLRARLVDASFFWEEDRRTPLERRVPQLAGIAYLGGLGNNLQRTERLAALSARIAAMMGLSGARLQHVRRAAHLCKADLLTGLVGEFPSLQGMVGRELALVEGEPEPVARAIAEHYLPAGAGDEVPASPEGAALALADKLDVMAGCFALGYLPSGSQDPYALRRNALGVLLICEQRGLDLKLTDLVEAARTVLEQQAPELSEQGLSVPVGEVLDFFRDRIYNAAIERGYAHDLVRATLSVGFDRPTPTEGLNYNVRSFWRRLDALSECARQPWWPALVELVDRTFRIQRDLEGPAPIQRELLAEQAERDLAALLAEHSKGVAQTFAGEHYVDAARRYCEAFAGPVHEFFEQVFVMVEDEALRRNRKALCAAVYHLFADRFADLYLIQTAEGNNAA